MFHVKPRDHIELTAQIVSEISQAGVECSDAAARTIVVHAELVLAANATLNLTRITEWPAVLERHIVDSVAWLPYVDPVSGPCVDLGSGAGYPGIPMSAVTGRAVTLCESVQKKARFLESAVAATEVRCDVYAGRSEDLARTRGGQYVVVTARAVSSLASLVEMAAPLLRPGGQLFALKGNPTDDELLHGDRAAALCGMSTGIGVPYALPRSGDARLLVIYTRTHEPLIPLPRRSGLAHRSPLGAGS